MENLVVNQFSCEVPNPRTGRNACPTYSAIGLVVVSCLQKIDSIASHQVDDPMFFTQTS
jgi:hypothetical protein